MDTTYDSTAYYDSMSYHRTILARTVESLRTSVIFILSKEGANLCSVAEKSWHSGGKR